MSWDCFDLPYRFISKHQTLPDVTRFSRRYPILQHGPWISAAAAMLQVKELHPCHNFRALHVRWVRRLGQTWARWATQLPKGWMLFPERHKGWLSHWNWNFKNIPSSKDSQLQLFRLIRFNRRSFGGFKSWDPRLTDVGVFHDDSKSFLNMFEFHHYHLHYQRHWIFNGFHAPTKDDDYGRPLK